MTKGNSYVDETLFGAAASKGCTSPKSRTCGSPGKPGARGGGSPCAAPAATPTVRSGAVTLSKSQLDRMLQVVMWAGAPG